MDFLKNLFIMIWFVSLIAFIVYWRKKANVRKAAGENYANDENYNAVSKMKRLIGIVCLVSFVIGAAIPESPEAKAEREAKEQQQRIEQAAKSEQKAAEKAAKEAQKAEEKAIKEAAKQAKEQEKAAAEANKYVEADIDNLLNDAQNNAAKANKDYKGKFVKIVGGAVFNIESNARYIAIEGSDPYTLIHVQCYPKNNQVKDAMINLSKGQTVTVYGKITDVGEILGYSLDMDKLE